ncbi:MAG: bifunctional methylenetetrahydrofolate dehydrogenase/methenyltetrahydrofolate cyclohydrolase FolD [Albimonas sp.]|uniref:bifunctional methylenetetrahydrofolate dehydrogenase/methenyltetrahydrofolate cyclohydrolase FolD n=1 Tax=Albimonas sp. TaxID=1872425 RepID=UPI004056D93B
MVRPTSAPAAAPDRTTARIIDGKAFAAGLRARLADHVTALKAQGVTPGLAVVLVGEDPASEVYVRNKGIATAEAGMQGFEHKLPADTSEQTLLELIARLNADPAVHGILVQLPLPGGLDADKVIDAIAPGKDVDGFHVQNVGRLATGMDAMVSCTPLGCLMLLRDQLGDLSGKEAVVVGRSNIVGKPMAQLLLRENCTVTLAHSRTRDLAQVCRRADILVAAVGRPRMVQGDWIKPGATVIDVGINRIPAPERGEGRVRLVGDVDFDAAVQVAGAITPVPGGVGPMTIACLLANTVIAASRLNGIAPPADLAY